MRAVDEGVCIITTSPITLSNHVMGRGILNEFPPIKKPPTREVAAAVLLCVIQIVVVRKRQVKNLSLYPPPLCGIIVANDYNF
jgi:hypothetical protein